MFWVAFSMLLFTDFFTFYLFFLSLCFRYFRLTGQVGLIPVFLKMGGAPPLGGAGVLQGYCRAGGMG